MRKRIVIAVVLGTALWIGLGRTGFAERGGADYPGGTSPPVWAEGFHGPPEGRGRLFISAEFWWGVPWWWRSAYPDYSAVSPPVFVQEAPLVYAQQESATPEAHFWYYCQNPPGYYPSVRECPGGWLTVLPPRGSGRPGLQQPRPGFFTSEGPLITLMLSHGQELGLTLEQIQKLQQLRTAFEKEGMARGAAIRAAESDLNALLAKDQWDLPAIEAKVHQLATLQGELRFERIKTLAAGRVLLRPEQLEQLKAIARWTPPPGSPEGMRPRPPYGLGGPGPLPPGPGGSPTPQK